MFRRGNLDFGDFSDILRIDFTCPFCSSHDFTSLEYDGHVNNFFWQGNFICWKCGKSCFNGLEFNHYHSCFSIVHKTPSKVVQLNFNF